MAAIPARTISQANMASDPNGQARGWDWSGKERLELGLSLLLKMEDLKMDDTRSMDLDFIVPVFRPSSGSACRGNRGNDKWSPGL